MPKKKKQKKKQKAPKVLTLVVTTSPSFDALKMKPEASHWDADEVFPPEDWRHEVNDDNTRLGYAEWVQNKTQEAIDEAEAAASEKKRTWANNVACRASGGREPTPEECWPYPIEDGILLESVVDPVSRFLRRRYERLNKLRSNSGKRGKQTLDECESEMYAIALLNNYIRNSIHSEYNHINEQIQYLPIPCSGPACDGNCENTECTAETYHHCLGPNCDGDCTNGTCS